MKQCKYCENEIEDFDIQQCGMTYHSPGYCDECAGEFKSIYKEQEYLRGCIDNHKGIIRQYEEKLSQLQFECPHPHTVLRDDGTGTKFYHCLICKLNKY